MQNLVSFVRMVASRWTSIAMLVVLLGGWGCGFEPTGFDNPPNSGNPDAGADAGSDGAVFTAACTANETYALRPGSTHGYRRVDTPMTYDEAFSTCAADGAHLVVIEDNDENDFVGSLTTTNNEWIGFDDLDLDNDTFRWVNGSTSAYTHWQSDQPGGGGREDCTTIQDDQEWHDSSCDVRNPFVCECDPGYRAPSPPLVCMTNPAYSNTVLLGRRYRFVFTPTVNWQEAENACAVDGAHLAVINDAEENSQLDSPANNQFLWIGYTDQQTEGQWVWVTGNSHPYTKWKGGEPNNQGGNEDCVEFRDDATWNDLPCMNTIGYICECDPKVRLP